MGTKWAGNGKKWVKNVAKKPGVAKYVGSGGTFAAAGVGALTLAKRDIILGGVKAKKSAVKNSRDKKKGDQETRIETQHASLPPRFRKGGSARQNGRGGSKKKGAIGMIQKQNDKVVRRGPSGKRRGSKKFGGRLRSTNQKGGKKGAPKGRNKKGALKRGTNQKRRTRGALKGRNKKGAQKSGTNQKRGKKGRNKKGRLQRAVDQKRRKMYKKPTSKGAKKRTTRKGRPTKKRRSTSKRKRQTKTRSKIPWFSFVSGQRRELGRS